MKASSDSSKPNPGPKKKPEVVIKPSAKDNWRNKNPNNNQQQSRENSTSDGNRNKGKPKDKEPEHPYRQVPEVRNIPISQISGNSQPRNEQKGQKDKEDKEPAYRLRSEIETEDEDFYAEVLRKIFDQKVENISLRDLLGSSRPLRDAVKKQVVARRVPVKQVNFDDQPTEIPGPPTPRQPSFTYVNVSSLPPGQMYVAQKDIGNMPKGSVFVSDPVTEWLDEGGNKEALKTFLVSQFLQVDESRPLKCLMAHVNRSADVECIHDDGSQIVSISQDMATKLGMSWDPDIRIQMQSANKMVESTLGLARNVPFRFEEVNVYLQVHVIRDPAYMILLGRPFDVATTSVITNFEDGRQLITITDPATRTRCTIPTFDRGKSPSHVHQSTRDQAKIEQDFH